MRIRRAVGALLGAALAVALLAPAAAGTTGGETFNITLAVSGTSGERDVITAVVVAKGVFSGNGRLVEVANQPGDPDDVVRDDLVFAEGTLHLLSTFGDFSASVSPDSCRLTATISQTSEIVGGTGLFAGASGSFDATLRGMGTLARNPDGSCAMDQGPLHEQDKIGLIGTLTY